MGIQVPSGVPRPHLLSGLGDVSNAMAAAALHQEAVREAPALIIIAAEYHRTTRRYGDRGIRYVHIEAGHAAQNASLMTEALGMGGVVIGAFQDTEVKAILGPGAGDPLLIIPIGSKPQ